jgi:hypothetical protein
MSSRIPSLVVLVVATAALGVADALPRDAVAQTTVSASGAAVQMLECSTGKSPARRRAVFRGEMKRIDGATRMQMRFELAEKVGRSVWMNVAAPDLGVWRESHAGIERFAYRQRVLGLQRGTAYRMTVFFRWLTDGGTTVREEDRQSPICRQPGKLANLKIRDRIVMKQGPTADTARYLVKVGNLGRVKARGVELTLRVDGAAVDTVRIGRLRSGQRRTIRFVGPLCKARLEAEIDPGNVVREITEKDNKRVTSCASAR